MMAAKLKNDGTRENVKRLVFEKESTHDLLIKHLTAVHKRAPQIITKAEVNRMIERRDETAVVPKRVFVKIAMDVDPSQIIFENAKRRKRWLWQAIVIAAKIIVFIDTIL